jgi:hypothetical protein
MKRVQYVRLISEIFAVGFTQDQINELCESMNLTWNEIEEIYQYAEIEWEEEKAKLD